MMAKSQNPTQRLERHTLSTEPHHLRESLFDPNHNERLKHSLGSGYTDASIPERGYAPQSHSSSGQHVGQPSGPDDKQTFKQGGSQKSHLALLRHAKQPVRPEDMQPSKDYDKLRVDSHQALNAQKHKRYTPAITLHRYSPHHEHRQGRKTRTERVVSSDNDALEDKITQRPSPLDTPAPRRHAPQPLTQHQPPKISNIGKLIEVNPF